MAGIPGERRDFFISRAGEDKDVALVIDEILRGAGYSTFIQDKDFGHTAFTERMDEGFRMVEAGARIVAILSRAYQEKPHCRVEAQYPLADDPTNSRQRLIVLRIEACAPVGFLKPIPYVDLVPRLHDAAAVRKAVLGAVDPARHREAADFAVLYRRSGTQILHPEVRPVPGFASREAELDAVEQALWSKGGTAALTNVPAAAAAVKGLGGVGKSVLAKEYAWRNRGRYQGVWWVRAEQPSTLLDDLIELGSHFIPSLKDVPEREKAARQTLDWLERAGFAKPWLVVYDNVEEPKHVEGQTPRTGAHVLITTRWSDWSKAVAPVKVGAFPPDVAAQFLLDATVRTDRDGADKLAAALGHLPLALDHAAAYIRRTGIDFANYANLAADLLDKAPKGAAYDTPVFATFGLAIAKAAEACPEAELLMGLCAFLAPDRIPLDLFTDRAFSEIERSEAVVALSEVSLITLETLDDRSPGLSLHRLVQAVMRGRLDQEDARAASALAIMLLDDALPAPDSPMDRRDASRCDRLSPHVHTSTGEFESLAHKAMSLDELTIRTSLLRKFTTVLDRRNDYARGRLVHSQNLSQFFANNRERLVADRVSLCALTILVHCALHLDPDDPDVANVFQSLQDPNQGVDAESLTRRGTQILTKLEREVGHSHADTNECRDALAELAKLRGRAGKPSLLRRLFGRA